MVDEVVEDGGVVVVVTGRVVVGGGRVVLVVVVEVVVAGVALSAQMKMRPFSRSALATAASASAVCAARSRQGGHIARATSPRAARVKRARARPSHASSSNTRPRTPPWPAARRAATGWSLKAARANRTWHPVTPRTRRARCFPTPSEQRRVRRVLGT